MPKAEANGIAIEYDSFGSQHAEPVLLISGLGVQMIRWTAAFSEMLVAQGYRVIRFIGWIDGAMFPELFRRLLHHRKGNVAVILS